VRLSICTQHQDGVEGQVASRGSALVASHFPKLRVDSIAVTHFIYNSLDGVVLVDTQPKC
jgi:hypothetical protein